MTFGARLQRNAFSCSDRHVAGLIVTASSPCGHLPMDGAYVPDFVVSSAVAEKPSASNDTTAAIGAMLA